ncbi:gibberellin-regulated protein 2-like [Macadamia integrifolia]|uniref:gibberellin-regulated protein 2-like n=1 Tax=Macadamia integrifolia TaxID=60698 RepID=UPI001C4FC6AF|nr:gibberellin-regulated protein 2-like [Macadamia integrifolia]XP_042488415.1 gibberellin-regulated protein 2-like [Macadamia integrifolia]
MGRAHRSLLLIVFCFLVVFETAVYSGGRLTVQGIDCGGKCNYRCSKASRHKICIRACNTCCSRCGCVPPGTSGNTDTCPCYAHMTTHGGRLKCP